MSEHELAVPIEPEEHYTPQSIFDALRIKQFDLDPAHPGRDNPYCCVPARRIFTKADDGLRQPWPRGALTFMNPPFGGRRGQVPWLKKFFQHRNGIALVAARTSADWFHAIVVPNAELLLFPAGKTKFIRPDGSIGKAPGTGTCLIGAGRIACEALRRSGLGACYAPVPSLIDNDRQADEDAQTLDRIQDRILADYQERDHQYLMDGVLAAEGRGK